MQLPKIGFGTWRVGGEAAPDPALEERSRRALLSALELGYTHFDTAEYYAGGHAEELLAWAIKEFGSRREDLFLTSKVSPEHFHSANLRKSCENSLRRLQIDSLDLYLLHWPNPMIPLSEPFKALNQLVREGKVKHVGVSNFKLKNLKESIELCETPLLTNQVPYSLPERTYQKNGVLDYCRQNDILLTAYSPVKFRNLSVNPTMKKIAKKHNATTFQIALAWLVAQPRVITIPMSLDPQHQKENLEACEIELIAEEMDELNNLYA
jgi:diketogulonate reductase-like aldo/keto reductase